MVSRTSKLCWRLAPFWEAPNELEGLLGALHRNRCTLAWKISGLDSEAMRRILGVSSLSLGGLVTHLALVGDIYFTHQLLGRAYCAPGSLMDGDDAWEWSPTRGDSPEALCEL